MWDSIKNLIGKSAPLVGTLLGGPAGGAVGGLIASAIGTDNDPYAIEAALSSDPNLLLKVKQLEYDYKTELQRMAIEAKNIELKAEAQRLADVQDARAQHKDSKMPATLTFILSAMVAVMFGALFLEPPSGEYSQVLIMITGTVMGAFGTTVAYWVGSSKGSADKAKQIQSVNLLKQGIGTAAQKTIKQ